MVEALGSRTGAYVVRITESTVVPIQENLNLLNNLSSRVRGLTAAQRPDYRSLSAHKELGISFLGFWDG